MEVEIDKLEDVFSRREELRTLALTAIQKLGCCGGCLIIFNNETGDEIISILAGEMPKTKSDNFLYEDTDSGKKLRKNLARNYCTSVEAGYKPGAVFLKDFIFSFESNSQAKHNEAISALIAISFLSDEEKTHLKKEIEKLENIIFYKHLNPHLARLKMNKLYL